LNLWFSDIEKQVRALKALTVRLFGIRGGGGVRLCGVSEVDGRSIEVEDDMREISFYELKSGDAILIRHYV
jgi:hypothetical protein